jgi:hypothetical protein
MMWGWWGLRGSTTSHAFGNTTPQWGKGVVYLV